MSSPADRDTIDIDHLPPQMLIRQSPPESILDKTQYDPGTTERERLIHALQSTDGNQTQAAKLLGINRVTVWNRMRKYGINLKREIRR